MQKTVPFVLVICLFFACIMAAAGWKATLEAADLKKEVVDKIFELGYVTDSLFQDAFVDSAAFEKWLRRLRAKVPALETIPEEDWTSHPEAAKLRGVWKSGVKPVEGRSSSVGSPFPTLEVASMQKLDFKDSNWSSPPPFCRLCYSTHV